MSVVAVLLIAGLWCLSGVIGFAVLVRGMLRWDTFDSSYVMIAPLSLLIGPFMWAFVVEEWGSK